MPTAHESRASAPSKDGGRLRRQLSLAPLTYCSTTYCSTTYPLDQTVSVCVGRIGARAHLTPHLTSPHLTSPSLPYAEIRRFIPTSVSPPSTQANAPAADVPTAATAASPIAAGASDDALSVCSRGGRPQFPHRRRSSTLDRSSALAVSTGTTALRCASVDPMGWPARLRCPIVASTIARCVQWLRVVAS